MAALGLAGWTWAVLGAVAALALVVLARVLMRAFAVVLDLMKGLEDSRRSLATSLEKTRQDLERLQEGLGRVGARTTNREEEWQPPLR